MANIDILTGERESSVSTPLSTDGTDTESTAASSVTTGCRLKVTVRGFSGRGGGGGSSEWWRSCEEAVADEESVVMMLLLRNDDLLLDAVDKLPPPS